MYEVFTRYLAACSCGVCTGLAFGDLYRMCREAFLVNSDLTLRTQLTEYRDHKLLNTNKVGHSL